MLQLRLVHDPNKPLFPFFRLPRELRDIIYNLVLEGKPDIAFALPRLHGVTDNPTAHAQTRHILAFTDQLSRTYRDNTDFVLAGEGIYGEAVGIHREVWSPSRPFPDPDSICGLASVDDVQREIDGHAVRRIWPLKHVGEWALQASVEVRMSIPVLLMPGVYVHLRVYRTRCDRCLGQPCVETEVQLAGDVGRAEGKEASLRKAAWREAFMVFGGHVHGCGGEKYEKAWQWAKSKRDVEVLMMQVATLDEYTWDRALGVPFTPPALSMAAPLETRRVPQFLAG